MTAELVAASPPRAGTGTRFDFDFVSRVAAAAVTHPSGYPWRLRPVDQGVEIRADHFGGAALSELGAQTVRLTVGAALLNLRLAIAVSGHQPVVTYSLDAQHSYAVAVVRRGVRRAPTPVERALFAAIRPGASTRRPWGDRPVPDAVLCRARSAVEAEGLWLRGLDERARSGLGALVDAVPRSAHLAAIGGNHDVPAVHLQAGLALQRLVLTAQALGHRAAIAAWPADLASATTTLPPEIGGPGLWPQVVVAIGAAPARAVAVGVPRTGLPTAPGADLRPPAPGASALGVTSPDGRGFPCTTQSERDPS